MENVTLLTRFTDSTDGSIILDHKGILYDANVSDIIYVREQRYEIVDRFNDYHLLNAIHRQYSLLKTT